MKSFLILCLLFSLFVSVSAQGLQNGELSFKINDDAFNLRVVNVDLNRSNLCRFRGKGEKTGDTLRMANLGFSLSKLSADPKAMVEPSMEFMMMYEIKGKHSYQFNTTPDGKGANWVEKSGNSPQSSPLKVVHQEVVVKSIELKDGKMVVKGEFSGEYQSPPDAPMKKIIQIQDGRFRFEL